MPPEKCVFSPTLLLPTTPGPRASGRVLSVSAFIELPRLDGFLKCHSDEQEFMAASFKAAMAKLAVLGHNRNDLIDCSDVVPATVKTPVKAAR